MKTSELTGPALAWAVAVADKRQVRTGIGGSIEVRGRTESGDELPEDYDLWMFWYPQANWSQAGPIIEQEKLGVWHYGWDEYGNEANNFYAEDVTGDHVRVGPTPLIAAMRCFVASRLGDEVEIPEELQ